MINSEKMIFDIGANCGSYSKEYSSKGFKVIAIEPQKHLCERIKNEQLNVIVINAIVSSSKEPLEFFMSNADTLSTCSNDWMQKGRFSNQYSWWSIGKIECISLDQLIEIYGIPYFIKIDVEGSELDVVLSLSKKVDCLFSFEWVQEFPEKAIEVVKTFRKLGYTEFFITNHPRKNILTTEQLLKHSDILFAPIQNFEAEIFSNMDNIAGNPSWGDVYIR